MEFSCFELSKELSKMTALEAIETISDFIPIELQDKYHIVVKEGIIEEEADIIIDFNSQNRIGLGFGLNDESVYVGHAKVEDCHVVFTFEPNDKTSIFGETLGRSFLPNDNHGLEIGEEMEQELLKLCFDKIEGTYLGDKTACIVGVEDIE